MCAGTVCLICESGDGDGACTHTASERHQSRPIPAQLIATVVRGGIKLVRNAIGNVTIIARGNGSCEVQSADLHDLAAALVDMLGKR